MCSVTGIPEPPTVCAPPTLSPSMISGGGQCAIALKFSASAVVPERDYTVLLGF